MNSDSFVLSTPSSTRVFGVCLLFQEESGEWKALCVLSLHTLSTMSQRYSSRRCTV